MGFTNCILQRARNPKDWCESLPSDFPQETAATKPLRYVKVCSRPVRVWIAFLGVSQMAFYTRSSK